MCQNNDFIEQSHLIVSSPGQLEYMFGMNTVQYTGYSVFLQAAMKCIRKAKNGRCFFC